MDEEEIDAELKKIWNEATKPHSEDEILTSWKQFYLKVFSIET